MAENTAIEWCDHTFNPWQGCTKVSPGCDNCYAEARQDTRLHAVKWGAGQPRKRTKTWGDPVKWNAQSFFECEGCGWRGTAADLDRDAESASSFTAGIPACPLCNDMRLQPARRRVFCASLGDVFDNEVPAAWRADLLMLIRATPNLDWLLLTKRIGNVTRLLAEARELLRAEDRLDGWDWLHDWTCGSAPPNVWLGATIVNQQEADRDIPKLLATPARVRFLSMEPLLGPVDLRHISHATQERADDTWTLNMNALTGFKATSPYSGTTGPKVDWVIVGGESGPQARPMHPDWARSLRDQCAAAGVPFLFKQWGEWLPTKDCTDEQAMMPHRGVVYVNRDGTFTDGSDGIDFFGGTEETGRVGKKAAGRLLDGVTHDGYPGASDVPA